MSLHLTCDFGPFAFGKVSGLGRAAITSLVLSLLVVGCGKGGSSAGATGVGVAGTPGASAGDAGAAVPATAPPTRSGEPEQADSSSTVSVVQAIVNEPVTGDLDTMVERRRFRVLVVPSKTFYFVEGGQPRGTAYESFKAFEDAARTRSSAVATSRSTPSSFLRPMAI